MKQSLLFTKTAKQTSKDEVSFNAQILIRAGFIDKVSAGVYTYLPLGLLVINKIINIVRKEMNAIGGQELLMPALTSEEIWRKTGRWDKFDVLFKLVGHDGKNYALGATHEEVITPLIRKFISSYKDLPLYAYQIQTKFRNEKRAKAGLIRGREFLMKDLYSFHASQEDLDTYYEVVKSAYYNIYRSLGLENLVYLTYASGGEFSKYSHEFQVATVVGEDHIYVCRKCMVAINKEIILEHNFCPSCGNKDLHVEKSIEVGNIFKLGSKFSRAFDFFYADQAGHNQEVIMGCYGLGLSRIFGTLVEVFHDQRGIIWPESIAPFRVHLLSLGNNVEADLIYMILRERGVEVLYDDRDISFGQKFVEADLIGCPYRLIIGKKFISSSKLELQKRIDTTSLFLPLEKIVEILKS